MCICQITTHDYNTLKSQNEIIKVSYVDTEVTATNTCSYLHVLIFRTRTSPYIIVIIRFTRSIPYSGASQAGWLNSHNKAFNNLTND